MPRFAAIALALAFALAPAATATAAPSQKRLPKAWAKKNHVGVKAGLRDTDRDGLSNWGEYRAHTNPRRADTDRDRVGDAAEDRDRDRLTNGDEILAGTDPGRRDTDRDHIADGREDADHDGLPNADEAPTGHALRNPDTDGDGIPDGRENAGRITAVAGFVVTVKLAAGGTMTARLDGDSWVTCDSTQPRTRPTASGAPATGSPDSGSSGSQTSAPDSPAEGDPDQGNDPTDQESPEEDDPAGYALADDDPAADADPVDDAGAPDLGECAAALRVGAFVEEATVSTDAAGALLTDLALMRG